LRTYIALGITALWAVSYLISVIKADYTGVSVTTPVVLVAAAYLLGIQERNGNGHHHG
jgi:hypothetical protein